VTHFQLQDPLWLLLLAALPLLAWRHHRRRPAALTYSRLPARAGRGTANALAVHLGFYLRLLALALVVVALARPQRGYAWEESLTEGIDIVVALDLSGSMGAEDFQPRNRLEVAKTVVRDFVARRPADRLGVVVFAGSALTRAPLTTDRAMLDLLVSSLALDTLPDGTAIGLGLASAAARLRDSTAKSKVVVLVTDGVNNAGEIDPRSAAAVCKGLGIRVYTVGVGTARGQVPVPMSFRHPITGRTERRRVLMRIAVDEPLLRELAARTGGRYFHAADPDALQRIFAEIDRLERTPLRVKRYVRYQEGFQPLAWGALALWTAPLLLAALGAAAEP
jgi:Ca-activated chloride channel family protein